LPSDCVQFLSLDEVLAIHQRVIEAFGGADGVRDLVDGNKRAAFFATDVFLRINGWRLDAMRRCLFLPHRASRSATSIISLRGFGTMTRVDDTPERPRP
jgi:hypothetical protein